MNRLMKSVTVLGWVIGLVMGSSFTVPVDETLEHHSHLRFDY